MKDEQEMILSVQLHCFLKLKENICPTQKAMQKCNKKMKLAHPCKNMRAAMEKDGKL